MARRHKRFPKTKDKPLPIKEWLNGRGNNRKKKPETSTRYYTKEEVEFMMEMSALKRKLGRMPTPGEPKNLSQLGGLLLR